MKTLQLQRPMQVVLQCRRTGMGDKVLHSKMRAQDCIDDKFATNINLRLLLDRIQCNHSV